MKVLNLFGGPGVGKSTLAARLFDRMKIAGKREIDSRLVSLLNAHDIPFQRYQEIT